MTQTAAALTAYDAYWAKSFIPAAEYHAEMVVLIRLRNTALWQA